MDLMFISLRFRIMEDRFMSRGLSKRGFFTSQAALVYTHATARNGKVRGGISTRKSNSGTATNSRDWRPVPGLRRPYALST